MVLKRSLGTVVSHRRVSHRSHLDSHQCRHKASPQAGRWWSRWHTRGERAYTPAPRSCLRRSCPHSRCLRRRPRLCWCSVLRTEGGFAFKTYYPQPTSHTFIRVWSAHLSPCSQTWQPGRTCVWRPRSSSRRSGQCSRCLRRSANAEGCTGRPSDTGTHLYDSLQGVVWLRRERCH